MITRDCQAHTHLCGPCLGFTGDFFLLVPLAEADGGAAEGVAYEAYSGRWVRDELRGTFCGAGAGLPPPPWISEAEALRRTDHAAVYNECFTGDAERDEGSAAAPRGCMGLVVGEWGVPREGPGEAPGSGRLEACGLDSETGWVL